jgi:glycosyltransferase involved in cell wall biosynthesis
MNILMIGPDMSVRGGMTQVQRTYFEHWDFVRYPLRHIGIWCTGSKHQKFMVALRGLVQFLGLLLFWHPTIVHVHFSERAGFYRESMFMLLATAFGVRTVFHSHAAEFVPFYEKQPRLLQRYVRFALSQPSVLVTLAASWQQYFRQLALRVRIEVLRNPVSVPLFTHSSHERPIVLMLGQLGQRKGTYDLLKVVPRIVREFPDVMFWLGGDGELTRTADLIRQHAWGSHVSLLGWVQEEAKHRALSEASVFVLPSYHEGLPVAVLEAMAYALPVITTPVGGIVDLIEDGQTGILIQPGDIDALADSLYKLLANPALGQALGQRAREHVHDAFAAHNVLHELYTLYESL